MTSIVDQPNYSDSSEGLFVTPWTLVIGGRTLYLEPLAQRTLAFVVFVIVGALVLRRSRPAAGGTETSDH